MATWNIEPENPNDPIPENLGNGKFLFSANDEDHDIVYTVTYEDNNGCSASTTFTQPMCECESEIRTRYTSTGDCFCDGIGYTVILYDKCSPSVTLASKVKSKRWEAEDAIQWWDYGTSVYTISFNESITYNGTEYQAPVTLNSRCPVRRLNTFLNIKTVMTGKNIELSVRDTMNLNICGNNLDIAGYGKANNVYSEATVEWHPTDHITFCDSSCDINDYTIDFPNDIELIIDGITHELYYVSQRNVWVEADTMLQVSLSSSIELTQDGAVNLTIKMVEG